MRQTLAFIALLLCGGCQYCEPYAHDRRIYTAIDGQTFRIVMERESGTAIREVIGPCPKDQYTPERVRFYTLTFNLAMPSAPPRISASVDMAYHDVPQSVPGQPWAVIALVRERLGLPGTLSLSDHNSPVIVDAKKSLTGAELDSLHRLGFDTSHEVLAADTPEGRWYLGFQPFADETQICCPARNLILHWLLQTDFSSMWDPVHHRLTVLPNILHSHRLYIPEFIAIWDYQMDQVTEYFLPEVNVNGVPLRSVD
jgi:hypothetical protein